MKGTSQQCFDAAWNGLKAQGFQMANGGWKDHTTIHGTCGSCAMGHIDRFAPNWRQDFFPDGGGFNFGTRIYVVYKESNSANDMERRLRDFARSEGLIVPGEKVDDGFDKFMERVMVPQELGSYAASHR